MEIVLLWCFVLAWMTKRGAEDLVHAVKGTPNPRYELKKQRAVKVGQPVKGQPRYGSRDWVADLLSDAMVAHTEKRRKSAKAKAQPVDDMIGILREPQPQPARVYDPNNTRNCPECKGEVVLDGRPCPRCLAVQQRRNAEWETQGGLDQLFGRTDRQEPDLDSDLDRMIAARRQWAADNPPPRMDFVRGWRCVTCNASRDGLTEEGVAQAAAEHRCPDSPTTTDQPTARIIRFPNINKEIIMTSPETTSLATAIAFAGQAATAHTLFATTGAEGYVGALEQGGNSGEVIGTAREAMEASGIAAEKWAAHKATLEAQQSVKEAYQGTPGAGDKQFLLNG